MGKITGFMDYTRKTSTDVPPLERIENFNEFHVWLSREEQQTQAARKGAYLIEGACSHTDVAPWLEEEVKPQAANWHSLDDVAHTLDGCIAKMAKLDKSINTTYFRQLVM